MDEIQNIVTDNFTTLLSEASKYKLSLALANQYMFQLPESIMHAIFGNTGTIIAFRVGTNDATILEPEFAPLVGSRLLLVRVSR